MSGYAGDRWVLQNPLDNDCWEHSCRGMAHLSRGRRFRGCSV